MKNINRALLLLAFLPTCLSAQSDSIRVLAFDAFMAMVRAYHPLAKQADLQILKGEAAVLQAKGAFDPYAFTGIDQKYFKNDQYYSLLDGGVKIPTRLGLELKAGYEQNQGIYRNPENNTPDGGLWYAGISLPLGQGLFIDQRRAALRQAQLYQRSTIAERQILLNELFYEAGKSYWDWCFAFNILGVFENALALAQQRFDAVRQGALLGDRPAVDTVEAGIHLQNRMVSLQQARLELANAAAKLSVFLWTDTSLPLELAANTKPVSLDPQSAQIVDPDFYTQLENLSINHPELQQYRYKLDQLGVEKRWKQEQLKPRLNLNYYPISEPVNGDPLAAYSVNNYKWGLEFSMPIFLRKARGSLRLAELKIQEAQFELFTKNATFSYKLIAALNEWDSTQEQAEGYAKIVQDYGILLNAERQLFSLGESSLFLVNAREVGYISAQVKLLELLAKNRKASLAAKYALGAL